jgi:hypothetical protein
MNDDEVPSEDIELINGLRVRKTGFALPSEPKVSEYEFVLPGDLLRVGNAGARVLEENAPGSASEYTGPPKRPQDVPIMPLSAALDCIASKGATDSYDRELYESAIVTVRDSIIVGDLFVSGQSHNKATGPIPSEQFRGVVIAHPYQRGNEFNSAIFHDGPVLDLCKNQLFVDRRLDWFNLMVAGRDISRFLPFEQDAASAPLSKPSKSAVANPRAKASKTDRQIFRARDFLWSGPVPAISWGDFEKSVEEHIIKSGATAPPSPSSFKRFKDRWWELILENCA